jgi:hypothetical protein
MVCGRGRSEECPPHDGLHQPSLCAAVVALCDFSTQSAGPPALWFFVAGISSVVNKLTMATGCDQAIQDAIQAITGVGSP